jgi:hypothetical protein
MSDLFEINQVATREHFPGGPNENPGIRLREGYLPGWTFAGSLKYVHVAEVTKDGKVIPSPVDAVAEETGRVLLPGAVVIVDISVEPPQVVKHVGVFVSNDDDISYQPAGLC